MYMLKVNHIKSVNQIRTFNVAKITWVISPRKHWRRVGARYSGRDRRGAIESARPDIARPSKLWGLTSREWTTRHHIARVDIARLVSVLS